MAQGQGCQPSKAGSKKGSIIHTYGELNKINPEQY